jgi:hypothetical protein
MNIRASASNRLGAPWLVRVAALVALTFSVSGAPADVRLLRPSSSVEVFDYLEFSMRVEHPQAENPFTDVVVEGEFSPPGEPPLKVAGFCDAADGSVFRIRFMPTKAGTHRYKLHFQEGSFRRDFDGAFRARKSRRPGLVEVDPQHPFHFIRSGTGEHWFWNATTTYQLLAWDDDTIKAAVQRLAGLGVNRLRVALNARTKDGKRWNEPLVVPTAKFQFKVEPWPATQPDDFEHPQYDVRRFNVTLFQKAERMLRTARDLDVMVSIIFYLDGADKAVDPFGKSAMGGADEQRYYRYAVARLGAFANVMWDVSNEWHLFRDESWVNAMGGLIKTNDPYHHLASVHGRDKFPFRSSAWADFAMFQCWDEHGGYEFMLNNRREQEACGRPMPQVNEEYGYEDHYPYPWGEKRVWPARIADNRRRLAWEMYMAGCYQTTGERANDGTGAGADTGGGWVNGRGNESMTMLLGYRHIKEFFTSFPWWTLTPRPDLAEGPTLLLAETGMRYVAYLPRGGAAHFQLAAGTYRAKWFDPRRGLFIILPQVILATTGNWTSPEATDAGDWALLLEQGPG